MRVLLLTTALFLPVVTTQAQEVGDEVVVTASPAELKLGPIVAGVVPRDTRLLVEDVDKQGSRFLVAYRGLRGWVHNLSVQAAKDHPETQIGPVEAPRPSPRLAQKWHNWALKLKTRDSDRVIAAYSEAIRHDPTFAPAYCNRAAALLKQGEANRAVGDMDAAVRLAPDNPSIRYGRGRIRQAIGDLAAAEADYGEAIWLDPYGVQGVIVPAYNSRAEVRVARGAFGAAIKDLNEAVRFNPRSGRLYAARGAARSLTGDPIGALADLDEAIRLAPRLATAFYNRGLLREGQGDRAGAAADVERALDLEPNYAEALHLRGIIRRDSDDLNQAAADFDASLRLKPTAEAYVNRGRLRYELGNRAGAAADLSEALRLDPKFAAAYLLRGYSRQAERRYAEAIADYEIAARLGPEFAPAHASLAWLLATCPDGRLRDGSRALEHATRACELTDWKKAGRIGTLAAAHAEAGQFDEAMERVSEAIALDASDDDSLRRQMLDSFRRSKPWRDRSEELHRRPVEAPQPVRSWADEE